MISAWSKVVCITVIPLCKVSFHLYCSVCEAAVAIICVYIKISVYTYVILGICHCQIAVAFSAVGSAHIEVSVYIQLALVDI